MPARPLPRRLLPPLLALAVALGPALHAHAYGPWGSYTINGITFDRGANGCFGPLVGVYGADALKALILATAQDYCLAQLASGTRPQDAADVEFADGGDSCPGARWVASANAGNVNGEDNLLGASTAFAPGCATEGFPVTGNALTDIQVGVNPVEAIAQCPGSLAPQGGSWNGGSNPCLGGA